MGCLGNILWFLMGGWLLSLSWLLAGVLCCLTVVGIPLGAQCFKFASMAASPFGKEIVFGGGVVSFLANIFWLIFCGLPLALESVVLGMMLCVTIIGIPFGLQHFKLAKLALLPFGAQIY